MTHRLTAVSGFFFSVLYVVFFQGISLIDGNASNAEIEALFSDSGYRLRLFAGAYALAFAGIALLAFLAGLHERLRMVENGAMLATIALGGGLLYVAMLFVSAESFTGYAIGISVGELPQPIDVNLARVLSDGGFGQLLIYGLFAAAALVLATSLLARRARLLPRWLANAGFGVAPLLLLGAVYMPQFLVPLWVLAVSVALLRRPATSVAPALDMTSEATAVTSP